VVLIGALSAGCADDVAPAVRVGDITEISNDDLMAEVEEWAGSDTLLTNLQVASTEGEGAGSYATAFIDFVLSNRIGFELHNAQFKELGLELVDEEVSQVRAGLFADPAQSAAVFEELSTSYGDRLVEDVARQVAVSNAMAPEDYQAWQLEAFTGTDIAVNPRYGAWDDTSLSVLPPSGPLPPPGGDLFTEL
jgi:hypothetical protein